MHQGLPSELQVPFLPHLLSSVECCNGCGGTTCSKQRVKFRDWLIACIPALCVRGASR